MTEQRPTYWQIVFSYLEEGYRAWQTKDVAAGRTVEEALGLSWEEGRDFQMELSRLQLIAMEEVTNVVAAYRLLPRGIAFMNGFPTLDAALNNQLELIDRTSNATLEQKQTAKRRWRDVIIEKGVEKGIDYVWDHRQTLWTTLRRQFPGLPELPL